MKVHFGANQTAYITYQGKKYVVSFFNGRPLSIYVVRGNVFGNEDVDGWWTLNLNGKRAKEITDLLQYDLRRMG